MTWGVGPQFDFAKAVTSNLFNTTLEQTILSYRRQKASHEKMADDGGGPPEETGKLPKCDRELLKKSVDGTMGALLFLHNGLGPVAFHPHP